MQGHLTTYAGFLHLEPRRRSCTAYQSLETPANRPTDFCRLPSTSQTKAAELVMVLLAHANQICEEHKVIRKLVVALFGAAVLASASHAQSILGISAISSPQGDFGSLFALDNAINQSGLSVGYTSGVTNFASYVASTTHASEASFNSGFTRTVGLPQIFSFDIGSVQAVDGFAIWATDNLGSVTAFNLYADNDNNFGNGVGSLLGAFNVSGESALSFADVRSFSAVSTRYLQLQVNAPADFNAGIGEFALRKASTTVPEPSTYAMMGAGLLALGLISRRRRTL